jgi:putative chitinase
MAEVTGDIGGQPVQLNNAATEATLRQLLAVMAKMGATGGGAGGNAELQKLYEKIKKSNKSYDDELKKREKAAKNLDDQIKREEKKKKADDEAAEADAKRQKQIQAGANELTNLGKTADKLGQGFFSLLGDLSKMGNDVTAVGGIFAKIPIVGGLVSSAFGAVAGAANETYKAFNTAASVGANFGGSIQEMQRAVAGTGLPLNEFTTIIKDNAQTMSVLGQGTSDGAKRFAQLSKTIRTSTVGDDLARLGYTTADINSGMARYAGMLSSTGKLQGMSNAQLVASTGDYLKNLDAVSKLTGESKAALQAQEDARKADAQYLVLKSTLGKAGGDNLEVMMNSLPKEMQDAAKEILATGTASGANAQKLMAVMPQIGQQLMGASAQMRATGGFSKDAMLSLQSGMRKSSEGILQNGRVQVMGRHMADEYGQTIVGLNKLSQQQGTLAEQKAKSDKELAEAAQKVKEGLDPASMKANMEKLADVSNKFMAALANSGIMEQLLDMFNGGMETMTPILLDALDTIASGISFVSENFGAISTILTIGAGLYLAYNAVVAAATLATSLQALGVTALLPALAGMAGAVWAVLSPLIPFAVAAAALVYAFKKMYDSGWTFGSAIQAVADNLKSFWLTLKDLMNSMLSLLPSWAGGISKSEAERRKAVNDDERKTLEANEKARDATRAGVAAERADATAATKTETMTRGERWKAERANTKATAENTAAKEAEKKSADAVVESNKNLDGTNPVETFKDFRKRMLGEKGAEERKTMAPATPAGGAPPVSQDAAKNLDMVEAALKKQGITDPKYIAAVKGNVMKESGGKAISENMNYAGTSNDRIKSIFGSRAAGKSDAELDAIKKDPQQMGEMMYGSKTKMGQSLGNNEPGDGFKYRGRGFIQLTGKSNYAAASKAIYGDDRLVQNPDLVNDPAVAAEVSAWYMKKGQAGMAKKMGIDMGSMSQEQANALATSQIAGTDVTKAGGYLGGENLNKVNSYAAQFASGKTPVAASTPSPAAAQAATGTKMVTIDGKQYAEGSAEAKAAQEALAKKQQAGSGEGTKKPGSPGQESAESLLASLNTKMDALIRVSSGTKDLNDKQLAALRGRGDAFQMGVPI